MTGRRSPARGEIVDAIRYVVNTGYAWRALPKDCSSWWSCYGFMATARRLAWRRGALARMRPGPVLVGVVGLGLGRGRDQGQSSRG
ncbi:transposase (plasmid) [Streptomyces sp. AHU1]|uniref:transposase n=1 Tax=Streptomyces sp. AHU1 TaxID=3377215 RepID=UPI003877BA88